MKKIVFLIYFISISSFAQLYVSPSSFVYAKNAFIFVQQDVNLDTNSNLYLRNEAQLLQGSAATSANVGAGKLSIFQEGTCNNFAYNYWCSPVGNASATVGNEPFGITMLGQPTSTTATTTAIDLPVSNRNGIANPLSIASRWIYKFLSATNYSQWIPVFNASTINSGQGFSMKGTSGTDGTNIGETAVNNPGNAQRYDFRGKPNDGNINISLGASPNNTLTGNPYPSAIDLKKFLSTAPGIATSTGIAYFWEDDKSLSTHQMVDSRGGYGTYSPVGGAVFGTGTLGIYTPAKFYATDINGTQVGPQTGTGGSYERYFCPVGQGFMLLGSGDGVVQMNNSYRVFKKESAANYSQFERNLNSVKNNDFLPETPSVSGFDYTKISTLPTPQIRFKTITNQLAVSQMVLGFNVNATDNMDFAMDAVSAEEGSEDLFFDVKNNQCVINVIKFDVNKKIPLGFRNTNEANFKISVQEMLNFYYVENVYVHDKITDIYHNITNDTFEVTMPAGVNKTRYEITFTDSVVLANNNFSMVDFDVYQNNNSGMLTISNPKSIDLKEISVFDISGKLVFFKNKIGNEKSYQFSTSAFSDAIYVVKLTSTDGKSQGKKIAIFKQK